MANILVLGVGPLPFEPVERLHAPGIRTWQIVSALSRRRHFVTLCVIEFGDFTAGAKGVNSTAVREDLGSNISLIKLTYNPVQTIDSLRTLHMATRFSSVISTSDIMNGLAADLRLPIPLWLDYNGDPFAEKQLQARLYEHDGSLMPQWQLYQKGLLSGDKFSVCSSPQRHAMIGQLAFSGRLTGRNSGEELVEVMPNCSRFMTERTPVRSVALKGTKVPAMGFLVLWSGGYNTWSDPETLFKGLIIAMKKNPTVYFATTGGALEGHDTKSFEIFHELVSNSTYRERFIFLGWLPTEEVGAYYEQADLAIYTDRYSVEGELGTRTRLVDWIQYRIPIACTRLCALSSEMAEQNLISTFPVGNPQALADSILDAAANQKEYQQRALRAFEWFDKNYREDHMLAPLLNWVDDPKLAKDRQGRVSQQYDNDPAWLSELAIIQLGAASGSNLGPSLKKDRQEKSSVKDRLRSLFSRKK